jgi:hypothetical protein
MRQRAALAKDSVKGHGHRAIRLSLALLDHAVQQGGIPMPRSEWSNRDSGRYPSAARVAIVDPVCPSRNGRGSACNKADTREVQVSGPCDAVQVRCLRSCREYVNQLQFPYL